MAEAELHHQSATELRALIASRSISSRELLDHFVARIERLNPAVNAVITLDVEQARTAADAADRVTTAGSPTGPLHGLSITVKDALAVAGMRSTGGVVEHADHVPERDADAVALVRAAGAIPFAKTNVPKWSGDLQTFNDLFGTTNNPWDHSRTPGGSSGGAATSVAMGFTSFEIGTDIGGSIRFPSAFCGVTGHKPSYGLVPTGGYIDRIDYGLTEPDVNVHGPIARSVDDLELLLDILSSPGPDRAHAITHRVPAARHDRIDRFRIAVWSDDVACPVAAEVRSGVEHAASVLASLGATVDHRARPDLDADACLRLGLWLVAAATTPSLGDAEFAHFERLAAEPGLPPEMRNTLLSYTGSHREWMAQDVARTRMRHAWRAFFGNVDALICPVAVTTAFPHHQQGSLPERTLDVDGTTRPYLDLVWWTILVGGVYLPSTVVPVGMSREGLPLAVQVVGPYLEDRTPLAVARALRSALGPIPLPG